MQPVLPTFAIAPTPQDRQELAPATSEYDVLEHATHEDTDVPPVLAK
jgi:hypothetical protein